MDPNVALARLREALAEMQKWNNAEEWAADAESISALANSIETATESFAALDGWLIRDGFLPHDWMAEEDKPFDPHGGQKHRVYEEN